MWCKYVGGNETCDQKDNNSKMGIAFVQGFDGSKMAPCCMFQSQWKKVACLCCVIRKHGLKNVCNIRKTKELVSFCFRVA